MEIKLGYIVEGYNGYYEFSCENDGEYVIPYADMCGKHYFSDKDSRGINENDIWHFHVFKEGKYIGIFSIKVKFTCELKVKEVL